MELIQIKNENAGWRTTIRTGDIISIQQSDADGVVVYVREEPFSYEVTDLYEYLVSQWRVALAEASE